MWRKGGQEGKKLNQVWKNANIQVPKCFSHNKRVMLPSPLKKSMLLLLLIFVPCLLLFSLIQAKLFTSIVKLGKWSVRAAMLQVWVTAGSKIHSKLESAPEYKSATHNTQLLPLHQVPKFIWKIPTVILFSCHFCLHLHVVVYHYCRVWIPHADVLHNLILEAKQIIFIDKAKRKKEKIWDSTYILWTFPLQSTSGVDSTGIDSWWLY